MITFPFFIRKIGFDSGIKVIFGLFEVEKCNIVSETYGNAQKKSSAAFMMRELQRYDSDIR